LAPQSLVPAIVWPIGGQEIEAHVDTGNMGGITLSPEVAKSLKLEGALQTVGEARTVTNRGAVRQARLSESLMLGRHELQKPLVVVLDFIPQANLGSQLLKHFVLTVDLQNERIRFAREGHEPLRFAPRFSVGVMLRREDDEVSIDGVVPGSAAEAAGLQAGDRVLAVNGQSLEEVGFDALLESFGKGEPVKLTVERGAETVEATVTPRKAE
jgi:predicted aspartyl protease